jgi:hypothetical protein
MRGGARHTRDLKLLRFWIVAWRVNGGGHKPCVSNVQQRARKMGARTHFSDQHRRECSQRRCSPSLRVCVSARSPAIMLANDHAQDHLLSNDDEDHHVNMQ